MKRVLMAAMLMAGVGASVTASASCYHLSDSPSDVYVCVGKNGRDDFADRHKAQDICSAKTGSKCGSVSSYSSSCHSNIDKCYDEDGNAHRELSGY